jgi:hypothetical protein
MMGNTDHLLPIRGSASGYVPLRKKGGPLHEDHVKSIAGLFSMGIFRGTTYHSPFALENTLFEDPDAFFAAVKDRDLGDFVIDDCYGGQIQNKRSGQYKEHVRILWQTVNHIEANWFVRGLECPPAKKPGRRKAGPAPPPPPPTANTEPKKTDRKPTYEEVLSVVTNKDLKFPMCGDLAGHLLTADYCDAEVCMPPDVHTMARGICKIDAGAISGLMALDYFEDRTVLDYVKQQSFMELYLYLERELTADEKNRLNWGPICLEHALCKYTRFISHPLFIRTNYSDRLFGNVK